MRVVGVLGLMAACLLLVSSSHAAAQDPEVGLANAETRAAAAGAEIPELEATVRFAQSRFEAAAEHAVPVRARARAATGRAIAIENSRRRDHERAVATVGQIEEEHNDAAEEHEESVRASVGFGIAALVIAVIALTWGWFRASAGVAYLARIQLAQAIGLCVGVGFLAMVVGAALNSAGGVVGVLGFAIFSLGLLLPTAFLLGRHSAEVQRERAKPLLGRERIPARATQAIAVLFGGLFLFGLGSAVFAGEADSREISAKLRKEAQGAGPPTPALVAARRSATKLEAQAGAAAAVVDRKRIDLTKAKRKLGQAENRLADAESDGRNFSRRLATIEAREARGIEREEREYEEALQEEEELAAEECDPSYSGCLDPNAIDYDCEGGSGDGPLYTGTVEVVGVDHYELDDDGDGIGCDP